MASGRNRGPLRALCDCKRLLGLVAYHALLYSDALRYAAADAINADVDSHGE